MRSKKHSGFWFWLTIFGPGLLVMLADTDAGSLVVSAQSGAVWGYKLLLPQIILIPILYLAQELAIRLGLVTGMGHGELIKKYFGKFWAWFSVTTLLISCVGAILTEFSGLGAVGELFGIPIWQTLSIVITFLIIIAWTGSYVSVERVAIFLGLFEFVFLYVAWHAKPDLHQMTREMLDMPFDNKDYLFLFAGNIGAVIMPWMIFFQQSAVLDKGLTIDDLHLARWDTAIGAFVTQLIMISLLVVTAATIGKTNPNTPLNTVGEISHAITPFVGNTAGRILFALGMGGSALVATIVVSLTAAWSVGEVLGFRRSLEDKPLEAPAFYGIYTLVLILGGILIASGKLNLVNLSINVEVMNAILLPIVLGFLFLLSLQLPKKYKLRTTYAYVVGAVLLFTSACGIYTAFIGIFH
jgi:NRAMP (natural resistance-associated macrophage protein)-like metal ion transporter